MLLQKVEISDDPRHSIKHSEWGGGGGGGGQTIQQYSRDSRHSNVII